MQTQRREHLANETTEQRDIRLEAMCTQQRDYLANETTEKRDIRLEAIWSDHLAMKLQNTESHDYSTGDKEKNISRKRDYHRSNCWTSHQYKPSFPGLHPLYIKSAWVQKYQQLPAIMFKSTPTKQQKHNTYTLSIKMQYFNVTYSLAQAHPMMLTSA